MYVQFEPTFLDVFVIGSPAPQGSKRYLGVSSGGKARFRESAGDKLDSWRADVRAALAYCPVAPSDRRVPVSVKIEFYRPRRKSDKVSANPLWTTTPDVDKLARAVLDCLESRGVIDNDAQVIHLEAWKLFASPGQPAGARIVVREVSAATDLRIATSNCDTVV